ncbi:MAG: DUF559 domain-containing protein [Hyphomonadaceae bacterium]|nr:DUF559 domain-containing protein [Hyphomonadaceae bacterium]
MRREGTTSEAFAWKTLRQMRDEGFPVRRQHPIGPYVADFAIPSLNLVIELDGAAHNIEGRAELDQERDERLGELGWRVVRLPAEIAFSPDHLLDAVRAALKD